MKIYKDLYEKICDITKEDYGAEEIKGDNNFLYIEDFVAYNDLVENLLNEIDHQKSEYKHLEKDLEDNYRAIPVSEQVGG